MLLSAIMYNMYKRILLPFLVLALTLSIQAKDIERGTHNHAKVVGEKVEQPRQQKGYTMLQQIGGIGVFP